jgi:hypothetical protein
MEVEVVHVPSCVTEHRTGHGMEHRTEGSCWDGSKDSRRPSDYGGRCTPLRLQRLEGGEEEIEFGAFKCVSEGFPGLEGLKLWIQPRPSLSR